MHRTFGGSGERNVASHACSHNCHDGRPYSDSCGERVVLPRAGSLLAAERESCARRIFKKKKGRSRLLARHFRSMSSPLVLWNIRGKSTRVRGRCESPQVGNARNAFVHEASAGNACRNRLNSSYDSQAIPDATFRRTTPRIKKLDEKFSLLCGLIFSPLWTKRGSYAPCFPERRLSVLPPAWPVLWAIPSASCRTSTASKRSRQESRGQKPHGLTSHIHCMRDQPTISSHLISSSSRIPGM